MNTENKYAVEMICSNCWQNVRMWFAKGTEVPRKATCPRCGCFTLSQSLGAVPQCEKTNEFNWFAKVVDTFFNGRKA